MLTGINACPQLSAIYLDDVMIQSELSKFWRITRPRFAIRKIFDNQVIIGVEYYVESGVTTRLD